MSNAPERKLLFYFFSGGNSMSKLKDETGHIYGNLTVLSRAENNSKGQARWNCLCSCGKTTTVRGKHLRSGHTTSCGCKIKTVGYGNQ